MVTDAGDVVLCHERIVVRVSRGQEIVIDDCLRAESSWVVPLLVVGRLMAILVHQRGMLPLHASAVAIDGRVCAFVGKPGRGKSTIAAALNRRGHPVLADDMLAVGVDAGAEAVAYRSATHLKIAEDIAAALDVDFRLLSEIHAGARKHALDATSLPASTAQLPLDRIYVLSDGDSHDVRQMHGGDCFRAIEQNAYVSRALLKLTHTAGEHFRRCAQLSRAGYAWRLQRPRSLGALPATIRAIEQARPRRSSAKLATAGAELDRREALPGQRTGR